jgi:putative redox protein
MIASAAWQQESIFDGRSQSGHTLRFDTSAEHTHGISPMEAVLTALCGCTSVDVLGILQKKREPITGLTVSAQAEQAPDPPRVFTRIHLTYTISGNVSREAAERAVSLSKNKYCSVSKMLEASVQIDYSIQINGASE